MKHSRSRSRSRRGVRRREKEGHLGTAAEDDTAMHTRTSETVSRIRSSFLTSTSNAGRGRTTKKSFRLDIKCGFDRETECYHVFFTAFRAGENDRDKERTASAHVDVDRKIFICRWDRRWGLANCGCAFRTIEDFFTASPRAHSVRCSGGVQRIKHDFTERWAQRILYRERRELHSNNPEFGGQVFCYERITDAIFQFEEL